MDIKKNLLLLFDRPQEPLFSPKGDKKQAFSVPQNLLPDKYKPLNVQLASRFGEEANELITVKSIDPPDLSTITDLGRHENFSLFIPKHRTLAGHLTNIFLDADNLDDFMALAVYAREQVNPYLFNYCYSVALLHRKDTQDLDLPPFINSFPDKFVDSKVFIKAREVANIVPEGSRVPIEIPLDYTASDLEEEHRLAYFREDVGINLHHWHWHLVYPFDGRRDIVDKNRRGELFYYMHQQIIARYNFEKLCNNMKRVSRLINLRDPIPEAYFPKLDSLVASRSYPARVANQKLQNLRRELEQEKRESVPLTEFEGIDVLGNIVESSILSPNKAYYGDFHIMGHVLLGFVHDPDNRHLESFSVMGDPSTTMRDPTFYTWHNYIDFIFSEYKGTLPRYTEAQLNYKGIIVTNIEIISDGGTKNKFNTFWQQSDVDLSRGMDFQPRGPVFVRFTHLQHQPFIYTITVNNQGDNRMGTCRIFMAPKFDERGNPWLFRDQRLMFIELDKFKINLKQGKNIITRASTQSSLTIPFERTFRDVDTNRPEGGDGLEQFNFCGCGWPQHMLIPKGSPGGFTCQLFVMISNYQDDKIEQTLDTNGTCNDADIFCGIKDKLYPDARSMGYPFDRMPRPGVDTLQQFLTSNMRVQDVVINFSNRILRPKSKT